MQVSVIVPTFNRAAELSKLLGYLLKQTTVPSEVVIVDDHTPDDSIKNVCKVFRDSFEKAQSSLLYVRNLRDRSANVSRNVGVKSASGDILMFFDDDMVLYDNYVERMVDVFKAHPEALGVQGWIQKTGKTKESEFQLLMRMIRFIFLTSRPTRNSCSLFTYPSVLTKIINCEALCGGAMALKKQVFNEFTFDEFLKKPSFMQDDLFSYSIFKKYPKSLFMTPFAKCIHEHSPSARPTGKQTEKTREQYRRYVLIKLFGLKGNFLFFWQSMDVIIEKMLIRLLSRPLNQQKLKNS